MNQYKKDQTDEAMGVPDVARMLGVHKNTVYNMIKNGDLEAFNVGLGNKGTGVRIMKSIVDEYRKNHRIKVF